MKRMRIKIIKMEKNEDRMKTWDFTLDVSTFDRSSYIWSFIYKGQIFYIFKLIICWILIVMVMVFKAIFKDS